MVIKLEQYLSNEFQINGLVENFSNLQIFFNRSLMYKHDIELYDIEEVAQEFLLNVEGISQVFRRSVMSESLSSEYTAQLLSNGFQPARSGDLSFVLNPGWMDYGHQGTTHGSSYSYDTHVPLIWYGAGIQSGESFDRVSITDIAPTVAKFFYISAPNGAIGNPIPLKVKSKRK